MSTAVSVAQINSLLDPYLFQVVGSTPSSVKDELVNSGQGGDTNLGTQLASICLLASATVKRVVEEKLLVADFVDARRFINKSLSINGKVNMSALTLTGHCLLASSVVDDVHFAKAARLRMGQRHLWDGDLTSNQLSDKQRGIMLERKKNVRLEDAVAFGGGFFKFFGMNKNPYTPAEAVFWGIRATRTAEESGASSKSPFSLTSEYGREPEAPLFGSVPSSSSTRPDSMHISRSSTEVIPGEVVEYCKKALRWSDSRIKEEADKQGTAAFVAKIRLALVKDPDMRGIQGKSVAG